MKESEVSNRDLDNPLNDYTKGSSTGQKNTTYVKNFKL